MRQSLLVALVVAAGLTVGAAVVVLDRHAPPPVAKRPVAAEPMGGGNATAALPPSQSAPPEQLLAPEAVLAPPAATATATAAAAPPASPAKPVNPPASDLPNVDVAPHTVHAVPDAEPPSTSVTIVDRNGRTIKELQPSSGLSPTYVPSVGPGGAAAGSSHGSARPILVPPVANSRLALTLPGATFNGKGAAVGGATLSVTGRNLHLFGVKLPGPGDRCGLGTGDNRTCGDVARDALAQRLQRYPTVACRVPPGQRGGDPAAICTDNSGTDLGDFLIGQGYALADTGQSFDYFGAESGARANRRGLWRNR
jgi:endonuclease YncB( thermonuclease family)